MTFKQYRFELSPIYCNGGGAGWTAPTPGVDADGQTFAQVARQITAVFVCEHFGIPASPYRAQLAGHFTLKTAGANSPWPEKARLAFFPHDQGYQAVTFPTPIQVAANEYIQASYTCSGAPTLQMNPTVIIQCEE